MKKVAVVYWSGTGNTEAMANSVAEGAKAKGADVSIFTPADFTEDKVSEFDAIAFGCPSMGAEVLEEIEFEPMWQAAKTKIASQDIALFGSYDWGDGEWMRIWEDECSSFRLTGTLIVQNEPGDDEKESCKQLGETLV